MDPSSESATDILAKVSGGRSPKNTTTNYLDKKNIPENSIFTTEQNLVMLSQCFHCRYSTVVNRFGSCLKKKIKKKLPRF